jgi:glycerophosphoryl diester phosphodiesterase
MAEFEYLSNDGLPIAFAHRGGAAEAERAGVPENSMQAFQLVTDLGYRYIETDVRATEDGELYTWHGTGVERVNKRQALKKQDIEAIRVNGERAIPLLREVLEQFPDSRFAVDPKHWPAVEPLAKTIVETKTFDRLSVGAFSQDRAEKVAQRVLEQSGIEICIGLGIRGVAETALHAYVLPRTPWKARSSIANLPRTASTEAMVEAAHRGGARVYTWVVNNEAEMEHFLDLGVDGIYTDEPSLLKNLLQKRQQWR